MKQFKPLELTFIEHTSRLLRHVFTPSWQLKRHLSNSDLDAIANHIEQSEAKHTAEIAIALETRLPWSYVARRTPSRERAWAVFSKMQVWDTPDNNGILIYFLMADKRIEIVADRACASIIDDAQWKTWVHTLYLAVKNETLADGLQTVVSEMTAQLEIHFPQIDPNQENRVSNRPSIF